MYVKMIITAIIPNIPTNSKMRIAALQLPLDQTIILVDQQQGVMLCCE